MLKSKSGLIIFFIIYCCDVSAATLNTAINSTVMLTSSNQHSYSGMIVGLGNNTVYIVTSSEAVSNNQSNIPNSLVAEFRQLPSKNFETTIVHNDINNYFAVLTVSLPKNHELTLYETDIAIYENGVETASVLGRLSLQELWQQTPLFNVTSFKSSPNNNKKLFLESFFEIPTFYGGPVFDGDWNLVGMAIRATQATNEFEIDELTEIIHINVLIKMLLALDIPLANHFLDKEFQKLSDEVALNKLPRLTFKALKDKNGYKLIMGWQPFRGVRIDNIQYTIYIENEKLGWQKNNTVLFNMSKDKLNSEMILSEETKQVLICHVTPLDDTYFAVGVMGLLDMSKKKDGRTILVNSTHKEMEPLVTSIKNPCDEIVSDYFNVHKMSKIQSNAF